MPLLESIIGGLIVHGAVETAAKGWERVEKIRREKRISEELDPISTEFNEALADRLSEVANEIDSDELRAIACNWENIAETVNAYEVVLENEAEAIDWLVNEVASIEDIELSEDEQAEFCNVLSNELAVAVDEFRTRIEGTELEAQFRDDIGIEVLNRLDEMGENFDRMVDVLSQDARNEGFRRITPQYLRDLPSNPETCWWTGFSLADVHDKIPAEREGLNEFPASEELFDILRNSENRIIVGRPGAGKSTLAKQVALRWYNHPETGEVFYRESGGNRPFDAFSSISSLKSSIITARGHVLVVVEDAVRPSADAIFQLVEELDGREDITFLFDARTEELERFDERWVPETGPDARIVTRAESIPKYPLSNVSVDDVKRVVEAFQTATKRSVQRTPEALHKEITSNDTAESIGELFLLSFLLPFGEDILSGNAEGNEDGFNTGLEQHIRGRYETVMNIDGETARKILGFDPDLRRDLSSFDEDLLADVGVMVNLLAATEIGVESELVYTLAHEHHIDDVYGTINDILRLFEGWFLYRRGETRGTIHELWSTLFLRELASDHANKQSGAT